MYPPRVTCEHGVVPHPGRRAWAYTAFVVALWAVMLPGVLVGDTSGFHWRPWPLVAGAGVLLVAATALVFYPARRLAACGARLMVTRPGPTLITDGVYGRVRNPIDVATTVIAFTSWMAVEAELLWVVPAAALVHFTIGVGLYEDRRLVEAFGDEFSMYRRRVPKWFPRGVLSP